VEGRTAAWATQRTGEVAPGWGVARADPPPPNLFTGKIAWSEESHYKERARRADQGGRQTGLISTLRRGDAESRREQPTKQAAAAHFETCRAANSTKEDGAKPSGSRHESGEQKIMTP
jgi:hypothetical protein